MKLGLTNEQFTLYGKAWLLMQEESIYGEGKLTLNWKTETLDGNLKMFVGLPDADGDIFQFNGNIKFLYDKDNTKIWSETLYGSVFQELKGDGKIYVDQDHTYLDGNIGLDYNTSFGLGGVFIDYCGLRSKSQRQILLHL